MLRVQIIPCTCSVSAKVSIKAVKIGGENLNKLPGCSRNVHVVPVSWNLRLRI